MACLFYPLSTVGFTSSLLVRWASDWLACIAGVSVRFVNISALSALHVDSAKKSRTLGMSTITGRWGFSPPIPCEPLLFPKKTSSSTSWWVESSALRDDTKNGWFRISLGPVRSGRWEGGGCRKATKIGERDSRKRNAAA